MKNIIFSVLLVVLGTFGLWLEAGAWDVVDSTTVTTYHSYTEPTENTDGTPLTDLHHNSGFAAQLNTDAAANAGNPAWDAAKAEKDQLQAEFVAEKARATAIKGALTGL